MKKVQLGDLVAVNDIPDGIVYEVSELEDEGRLAKLRYQSGYKWVSGGDLPVSMLKTPTKEQLINNGLN